jgi:hypothetical protein
MFPLNFPYGLLARHARPDQTVFDPFCGRGTSNFAARLLGLKTFGTDTSAVAVASTKARLANASPSEIICEAALLLRQRRRVTDVPSGVFWRMAFHPETLADICTLREALNAKKTDPEIAPALMGIMLGALHGPTGSLTQSYFSNQCPRTYAPKPRYAVRFWREKRLRPPKVNVLAVIEARANRYYGTSLPKVPAKVRLGDSRSLRTVKAALGTNKADWIITSPPYYGLRTYVADQWLRAWLLGGPAEVDYDAGLQLKHSSSAVFASQLRTVWQNVLAVASTNARLVIRFGSINDRPVDPQTIIKTSLQGSGWEIATIRSAGTAMDGKRQANTFVPMDRPRCNEIDVYCRRSASRKGASMTL